MNLNIIKKRLISGSILRVMLFVSNVAISFFVMPFLIHSLGDRWYGCWTLAISFVGYYGFLDLGLSSAVSRFISREDAQNNNVEINKTISTSLILFSILGIFSILISLLAAFLCPYFMDDYKEFSAFRYVVLVLGLNFAIGLPMRTFIGILNAKLRYDLIVYVDIFKLVFRNILIVIFIKQGYGVKSLASIILAIDLIGYYLTIRLANTVFSDYRRSLKLCTKNKTKQLLNYSVFSLISQVADLLRFNIDSFIIAGHLGLASVTHYSIALTLINYFRNFILSAIGIMSPVFSQLEGKNDVESIKNIFFNITRISFMLSFYCGGGIIIIGNSFLIKWVGDKYSDSYLILLILCVPISLSLSMTPTGGLLFGLSKHKVFAVLNLCEGVVNLGLSLVLVNYFGMIGVALGTAIPILIFRAVLQILYVCRVVEISFMWFFSRMIVFPVIKIGSFIGIFYYFLKPYMLPDFTNIIMVAFFYSVSYSIFCYCFCLTDQHKSTVKEFLGKKGVAFL
jgi:O-antigen/teichoic acid export membrane protein